MNIVSENKRANPGDSEQTRHESAQGYEPLKVVVSGKVKFFCDILEYSARLEPWKW